MSYKVEITVKDATNVTPGRAIIAIAKKPRQEIQCQANEMNNILPHFPAIRTVTLYSTRTGYLAEVEFKNDWSDDIRNAILNSIMKSFGEHENMDVTVSEREWYSEGDWESIAYAYHNPDTGWH